jgi:membrane protease YdiL (CAAX protease family)
VAKRPTFRAELRDLLAFIRRPRAAPRPAGHATGDGFWRDWFPAVSLWRLFQWALLMWAINLLFLGPIAVMAATIGGATHRLNLNNIPWMAALLWAPIVEELVFRYGLRRLKHLWWLLPLALGALFNGPGVIGGILLAAFLAVCWLPYGWQSPVARRPLPWRMRSGYLHAFPWAFHLSSVAFSAVHLYNFNLAQTPLWLLPLLVLPQWVTGMVLGWLRVRHGIGASILLHAIFNGGPLLVVWLVLRSGADLAL